MGMLLMCGLVLLRGNAAEEGGFALRLALAGVAVMVITSLAYVIWIAMAPYQAPSRSIERLISGDLALLFWGAVVVIGLVVPAVLTGLACMKATKGDKGSGATDPKKLAWWLFAAFACSGVGAVALRVIMYDLGTSVESFILMKPIRRPERPVQGRSGAPLWIVDRPSCRIEAPPPCRVPVRRTTNERMSNLPASCRAALEGEAS